MIPAKSIGKRDVQGKNAMAPSIATLEMVIGILGIASASIKTLADSSS